MRSNTRKIIVLVLCVIATFIGIYLQFIAKDSGGLVADDASTASKDNLKEGREENMQNKYDYTEKELPQEAAESEAEVADSNIYVYYSNTELLDKSSLPLDGQAKLNQASQEFLISSGYDDVSELYIDNETFLDNEEKVQFSCFMDGYQDMLQVTYQKKEQKLKFNIVIK